MRAGQRPLSPSPKAASGSRCGCCRSARCRFAGWRSTPPTRSGCSRWRLRLRCPRVHGCAPTKARRAALPTVALIGPAAWPAARSRASPAARAHQRARPAGQEGHRVPGPAPNAEVVGHAGLRTKVAACLSPDAGLLGLARPRVEHVDRPLVYVQHLRAERNVCTPDRALIC